jgi:hypothetical protein
MHSASASQIHSYPRILRRCSSRSEASSETSSGLRDGSMSIWAIGMLCASSRRLEEGFVSFVVPHPLRIFKIEGARAGKPTSPVLPSADWSSGSVGARSPITHLFLEAQPLFGPLPPKSLPDADSHRVPKAGSQSSKFHA